MVNVNPKAWSSFLSFAKEHVRTWDVDPAYPLLKAVYKRRNYKPEDALKFTMAFVGFYNLESTELFMNLYFAGSKIDSLVLQKATERRGFRGNRRFDEYFEGVLPLVPWLLEATRSWTEIREKFETVKWNGTWASYKFADLLKNSHSFNISAPDFGVGGGGETAGPIPGMVLLTGLDWKRCATDIDLQKELFEMASKEVPFEGMEMMETSLCDFNSWFKGRYYVGHDIDNQMEQLRRLGPTWWEARREIFPKEYLGECNNWFGVRREFYK